MENKIKHLEFIQNVITRMASNSFLLRGWAVTLIIGLLAFANTKDMDASYTLLALVPLLFFWGLDGFYVRQEKLFRSLYDHVRLLEDERIDFSMDTRTFRGSFMKDLKVYLCGILPWFYLPLLIAIILVVFISPYF